MKTLLLTISTTALLLVGQSAMALSEDSSGYELLTSNTSQSLELPMASYRSDDSATLGFTGGSENDTGMITTASTFKVNHAQALGFNGGNESGSY